MSRKRDPVLAVLTYFETAELPLVQQALALAQQIVRRRAPKGPPRPKPKTKPRDAEGNLQLN
jgi:hypothetical protein